jgi:hypothetical protein
MTDGYLSRNRPYLAAMQRKRRATHPRIDYYPSPEALALIESRRTRYSPTHNNSGIIDTIIGEWAQLAGIHTGINKSEIAKPKSSAMPLELCDKYARTRMTSATGDKAKPARMICGARRGRDGQPCQGLSVPGKRRCKWHGGASTGPRTDEGRVRSIANLVQFRAGQPVKVAINRPIDWRDMAKS